MGTSIGNTIRLSHHSQEQMLRRKILGLEVLEALGAGWTIDRGAVQCGNVAHDLVKTGGPLAIGHGRNPKHGLTKTLLGVTKNGRHLHLAVAASNAHTLEVITAWDPTSPENEGFWHPTLLVPTSAGARTLPSQRWIYGDPYDRRAGFTPRVTVSSGRNYS